VKQHFPRAAWILTILAVTPSTLPAVDFNVSRIATGTHTGYDFAAGALKPFVIGSTLIHHFNRGLGDISSENTARYLPSPWNAVWKNAAEYPVLERTEDTPAPTASLVYLSPYYQQARVDMAVASPKSVKAHVFQSGDAAAKVSYSLRIQHTGANPADYILTHQVPDLVTSHTQAYSLCCPGDSNGGTYLFRSPTAVSIRATADLYVNGLAIWSSGKTYRYPEAFANGGSSHVDTQWGRTADTGSNRFFLGLSEPSRKFLFPAK